MIPAVLFAPVVKLVYHASLSRRRSPVRIRSGAPVLLAKTAQSEPFLLVNFIYIKLQPQCNINSRSLSRATISLTSKLPPY